MSKTNKPKMSHIVTAGVFILAVVFLTLATWFYDAPEISYSERRVLATLPELSFGTVASGDFMTEFETYTQDSFWRRDDFRHIKALAVYNLFRQKDNNGIYIVQGSAAELEKIDRAGIIKTTEKLNKVIALLPEGANIYYTIIPSKGYYLAEANGYPAPDYALAEQTLNENMSQSAKYIDIKEALGTTDYYATDLHWEQHKLGAVCDTLATAMQAPGVELDSLSQNKLPSFYGVYFGQSALNLKPDTMTYLTGGALDSASVQMLDPKTLTMQSASMYYPDKFSGIDPYELFLAGAQPLIVIENADAAIDKPLVVFRDSFTSSLAPLLSLTYSKVTLVDLRYMASTLLNDLVEIEAEADILFLYGMQILNSSELLLVQ